MQKWVAQNYSVIGNVYTNNCKGLKPNSYEIMFPKDATSNDAFRLDFYRKDELVSSFKVSPAEGGYKVITQDIYDQKLQQEKGNYVSLSGPLKNVSLSSPLTNDMLVVIPFNSTYTIKNAEFNPKAVVSDPKEADSRTHYYGNTKQSAELYTYHSFTESNLYKGGFDEASKTLGDLYNQPPGKQTNYFADDDVGFRQNQYVSLLLSISRQAPNSNGIILMPSNVNYASLIPGRNHEGVQENRTKYYLVPASASISDIYKLPSSNVPVDVKISPDGNTVNFTYNGKTLASQGADVAGVPGGVINQTIKAKDGVSNDEWKLVSVMNVKEYQNEEGTYLTRNIREFDGTAQVSLADGTKMTPKKGAHWVYTASVTTDEGESKTQVFACHPLNTTPPKGITSQLTPVTMEAIQNVMSEKNITPVIINMPSTNKVTAAAENVAPLQAYVKQEFNGITATISPNSDNFTFDKQNNLASIKPEVLSPLLKDISNRTAFSLSMKPE